MAVVGVLFYSVCNILHTGVKNCVQDIQSDSRRGPNALYLIRSVQYIGMKGRGSALLRNDAHEHAHRKARHLFQP
jgi:hypothetical protein